MTEGKPYRYGLIVAGLCVAALGLFIMTQERPHVYGTMCAVGVTMVCVGTAWSLCQCYPKVIVAPEAEKGNLEDLMCAAVEMGHERCSHALPGQKPSGCRLLREASKNQCHSCPTLHLV